MGLKGVVDCCAVLAFVCSILVFIGHVVAFATHFWLESIPGHSEFKNLGMHEACYERYRHPSGDFDTLYTGCYGYWDDYYLQIRRYLLPGWFVHTRTLVFVNLGVSIFTFILGVVTFLIMIMDRCLRMKSGAPCQVATLFFTGAAFFVTGIIELIAIATFYSNCWDRKWMPRPEVNRLGYSYWMAVAVTTSALIGFMSCVLGGILNILHVHDKKETDSSNVILGRY